MSSLEGQERPLPVFTRIFENLQHFFKNSAHSLLQFCLPWRRLRRCSSWSLRARWWRGMYWRSHWAPRARCWSRRLGPACCGSLQRRHKLPWLLSRGAYGGIMRLRQGKTKNWAKLRSLLKNKSSTGRSSSILHRKWKYSLCCLRDVIPKIERYL